MDLQFLLLGGELVKVRSRTWRKNRFFKLQEDCKTFWHESHKTFRRNQTCECLPLCALLLLFILFSMFPILMQAEEAAALRKQPDPP